MAGATHGEPPRIAVLASGRGSNLQALIDAIDNGRLFARIVGVFSDRPAAEALRRVDPERRWSLSPRECADRTTFELFMAEAIDAVKPDWIICAGYMRILGDAFVHRFRGRLVNIHPSLLPRHRGLHTHASAIEAGDTEHGASVHFVVPELDAGPVIAQARVAVAPDDTPDTLARRVLAREHPLLIESVRWLVSGRVQLATQGVIVEDLPLHTPLQLAANNHFA